MTPPPTKPEKLDQPPLGKSIPSTYNGPVKTEYFEDNVVVVWKELDAPDFQQPVQYSPHPNTEEFPDHVLDTAVPDDTGKRIKLTYIIVSPPAISFEATAEGLVDMVTASRVRDDAPKPVLSALRVDAKQRNLMNGDAELIITDEPSVFPASEFEARIADRVPIEFQDQVPTEMTAETEEGQAAMPVLGPGELSRTSRKLTPFRKRDSVTRRDLTLLPRTLHDRELDEIPAAGAEFGGVFDTARTLASTPQDVEEGFTIIKSSVKNLGADLTLRETKRLDGALPARLELTFPGSGFSSAPAVVFGAGDMGSGATGTAVLGSVPVIPPSGEPGGVFTLSPNSFGDTNGVFYFLGARYNGGVWRNPFTAGNINIGSTSDPSHPLSAADLACLVDRQPAPRVVVIPVSHGGGHQILFDMGVGRTLKASQITIRQTTDSVSGSIQHRLQVQASNSLSNPVTIGDGIPIPQTQGEWSQGELDDSVGYRYFRIFGTDDHLENQPDFWPALILGEIEFYGELTIVPGISLVHSFDGDTHGAFYYLGALGNGGVWRNPHTNNDIECAADNLTVGALADLVDRQPSNIGQDATVGRTFSFDLKLGRSLVCNNVSFRQRSSAATACNVVFQGTNVVGATVNGDWTTLANFTTPTAANAWLTTAATGTTGYRRFRLVSQTINFRIGEAELYGALTFPQAPPPVGYPVESVTITDGGSGYAEPPAVSFDGDGTGAAGTAVLNDTGSVASVLMTNHGSGYTTEPTVTFSTTGSGGSGAAATAIIDGQVTEVGLISFGSGYDAAPDVIFSGGGGGSGAAADAVLAFALDHFTVTSPGSGYTSNPTVTLTPTGGAVVTAVRSFGLNAINVSNGGSSYGSAPTVNIAAPTGVGGVQATAHAVLGTGGSSDSLVYVSDGDTNGVFYRIGTNFGAMAWSNPQTSGAIVIGGGSLLSGTLDAIVDRAPSDTYTNNFPNEHYDFDLGAGRTLALTDWAYRSRSGVTSSTPTQMTLSGSNDGITWTPIGVANLTVSTTDEWFLFSDTSSPYRYFQLMQTATNSSGGDHFTIGEFELYGTLNYGGTPVDQVESVVIDNAGAGYVTAPAIGFTGSGSGAAALAVLQTTGPVDSIAISNAGWFETLPSVGFSSGGGTGAAATAVIATTGRVNEIVVTAPGFGYQTSPDVAFDTGGGPGTGAVADTAVIEGVVTGFTVTNGGAGYDVAPSVDVAGDATATAVVDGGVVTSLVVGDPGSGYNEPPAVVFSTSGGPQGEATIAFGVSGVSITNGGSGYAGAPPVLFVGDGRSVAGYSVLGRPLASVEIINGGSGYGSTVHAGVASPNGNAGATVSVQRSFGIESATVDTPGSGYTSDPDIKAPSPAGTDAVFKAFRALPLANVIVTNPGDGYTSPPAVGFAAPPSGTTAVGTAVLGFGVDTISMDAMGSGYTSAPTVELRSSDGSGGGAFAVAELLGRVVDTIIVDAGGSGYTSPPTVVVGDGSGATAHAVLTGAVVTSIVVDTPGSGYTSAPDIHILNDGGGTGAHAVATLSAGQDIRINVTSPGAGYEAAPDVIITLGGGTGAAATATLLAAGKVKRVELSDVGSGYVQDTPIVFTGGAGTGAAGTAVRDTTAAGPLGLIAVLQPGAGYTASTVACVISNGGGTGAAATAVKKTLGSIKSVTVTAPGAGFEAPPVIVIAENMGGVGTGAIARSILANTGKVVRVVMTSAGEGFTVAPVVSFPASDGTGAAGTAHLNSTGSIETLILTVAGGPFSVAPLVSFEPTGSAPLATALYLLPQVWPTLFDEITDPTDKIIVRIVKDIVVPGTELPVGYSEIQALNKYRSVQIVSSIDLHRLPPTEIFFTTQHVALPNQLLSVTPVWSTRFASASSVNGQHTDGSSSAAVDLSGTILVLKTGGFRGAAIARVERTWFFGIPPASSVPLPTIIRPSSGTAYLQGGSNSVSRSGSPNGQILNIGGSPAQPGDIIGFNGDGTPIYFNDIQGLGTLVTSSNSSSVSSNVQIADISDVLTTGIFSSSVNGIVQSSDVPPTGGGIVGYAPGLTVEASIQGLFSVNIPASCPASIQPGSNILQEVNVEKRRFNLYVRTIVFVIAPGLCEAVGGTTT